MAKRAPKETSLPLVITLVFFILTTIAFGVMWYMQYSDQQAKDEIQSAALNDFKYRDLSAGRALQLIHQRKCVIQCRKRRSRTPGRLSSEATPRDRSGATSTRSHPPGRSQSADSSAARSIRNIPVGL